MFHKSLKRDGYSVEARIFDKLFKVNLNLNGILKNTDQREGKENKNKKNKKKKQKDEEEFTSLMFH